MNTEKTPEPDPRELSLHLKGLKPEEIAISISSAMRMAPNLILFADSKENDPHLGNWPSELRNKGFQISFVQ